MRSCNSSSSSSNSYSSNGNNDSSSSSRSRSSSRRRKNRGSIGCRSYIGCSFNSNSNNDVGGPSSSIMHEQSIYDILELDREPCDFSSVIHTG